MALEEVLQQILPRRPELSRVALVAQLQALAKSTPPSLLSWTEYALGELQVGQPLPWEPGARRYQ